MARAVVCPVCSASWRDRDARFCGNCGSGLVETGRAATSKTPRRPRAPDVRWMVLAGATVAVLGLATWAGDGAAGPAAGDPDVALPEPGTAPSGRPLSDERAAEIREQLGPRRLRCEPAGCELWYRDGGSISQTGAAGDLLVLFEDDRLIGLDAAVGEERWTASLQDLVVVTGDGDPISGLDGEHAAVLHVDRSGVLLVTDRAVVLIDLDGERRWTAPNPGWSVWNAQITGDRVLLEGADHDGGGDDGIRLVALDLADGRISWERDVGLSVWSLAGPVILLSDQEGTLVALDPSDGTLRWEHRLRSGRAAVTSVGEGLAGPWVVLEAELGWQLLDQMTGDEVARLNGRLVQPLLPIGDRFVTVIAGARGRSRPPGPTELIAIRADGEILWRVPFQTDDVWGCCTPLSQEGGVVTAGSEVELLRVEAETGRVLERRGRLPTDGTPVAADGTVVRYTGDGMILKREDAQAQVLGGDAWIESPEPLVIGGPGGQLLGVGLVPGS